MRRKKKERERREIMEVKQMPRLARTPSRRRPMNRRLKREEGKKRGIPVDGG